VLFVILKLANPRFLFGDMELMEFNYGTMTDNGSHSASETSGLLTSGCNISEEIIDTSTRPSV
jgi:hypothetical protein